MDQKDLDARTSVFAILDCIYRLKLCCKTSYANAHFLVVTGAH